MLQRSKEHHYTPKWKWSHSERENVSQQFCILNVAEELTGDPFQLLLQSKMRRCLEM